MQRLGLYFIEQSLDDLLDAVGFVDKIIFGRTNYSKETTAYVEHKSFYNEKAAEVIRYCEQHHIAYHIKDGTITD